MMTSGRLLASPRATALLGSSILARLPLAMFSIALLVHAQRLSGSFAVAGLVTGAYALASAVASPLLGRLVDRCGQTGVLVGAAACTAVVLAVDGALPHGTPAAVLVLLGGTAGFATPPLDACVRTLLPRLASDPVRLPALFALESTVLELTFVAGPPLALGLGALWSPGGALIVSGLVMLGGTLVFVAQPASRDWRAEPSEALTRAGALRSPAIRTLVLILFFAEAVFGVTEVGVTAAAHGTVGNAAAGPLLGLWGLGSLLGGIVATRLGGGASTARGLVVLLVALGAGHAALGLVTRDVVAMAVVITVAGATIAPTVATLYAIVDRAAPAAARTEAYAWTLTASLVGASLGSTAAGIVVQHAGAAAAFGLAACAGMIAVAVAVSRGSTLPLVTREPRRPGAPAPAGGVTPC